VSKTGSAEGSFLVRCRCESKATARATSARAFFQTGIIFLNEAARFQLGPLVHAPGPVKYTGPQPNDQATNNGAGDQQGTSPQSENADAF
jgi:hypothetical protein